MGLSLIGSARRRAPSRRVAVLVERDAQLFCVLEAAGPGGAFAPPSFEIPSGDCPRRAIGRQLERRYGVRVRAQRRVLRCRGDRALDWWVCDLIEAGLPRLDPEPARDQAWRSPERLGRFGATLPGFAELLADWPRRVRELPGARLRERRLELDGLELCYCDEGEGAAPPLLLIHGLGVDLQVFRWILPRWARRRRVLALDLLGHGRSAKPGLCYLPELHARVVARFIERLGCGPVQLLGYSMGGHVSQIVAARRPELVERLILLSSAGLIAERPSAFGARALAVVMRSPAYPWLRQRLFSRRFEDFYARHNAEVDVLFREGLSQARRPDFQAWLTAVSSSLEGLARCSVRPFLERIEAPTRLLYGEVDTVTPSREGFELAAGIRRASLRVFPGCGHLLHVEARDEVFAEVEGFLGAEIEPGESNR